MRRCDYVPLGGQFHQCTRPEGHDGPCAHPPRKRRRFNPWELLKLLHVVNPFFWIGVFAGFMWESMEAGAAWIERRKC